MSKLTDKLSSAEYIYSASTKWGLKRYVCDVEFFTEEPLDDLYFVICSILDSNKEGYYDKRSLGILLGFSMINQESDGKHEIYYDVAEVRLFEDILAKVEAEHLIKTNDQDIFLTELGRISVRERKHYQFYLGTQDVYEHSMLRSKLPTAMLMFPFYKDMGIYTKLLKNKQIWPEDEDVKSIIFYENDQLKKRLELQSQTPARIYKAKLQQYFDPEVKKIPVRLYLYGEEYIPAIMNGSNLAVRATELVCEELNAYRRENIVLECLFQKLWDDRSAVLDYTSLEPYVDLIDYEELTKDTRTVWSDLDLLNLIVNRATSTCWRNISRHCDIDVLREFINDFKDHLDWPIITERIDDDFLLNSFIEYPWDLEILSEDLRRKESVIEQLILLEKETEEEWNWDELEKRLSIEFVLAHLDVVKVDLASFTEDTQDVRKSLLDNLDKRWDWCKIEKEFDLDFIYDHISVLGDHFSFIPLFERVFTDDNWAGLFTTNSSFKIMVAKASKKDGPLSSTLLNDKNYKWSDAVIDLLVENGLLCWGSTPYMVGFECNPYLNWTKSFFYKYAQNITTEEGRKYVSSQIKDVEILSGSPTFEWDWDVISSNKSLLSAIQLYASFGEKLNWSNVFENQKDAKFLQSITNIRSMIGDDSQAWTSFSSIADIDYVKKQYIESQFPWDWTVLTERMFPMLKLENLGNKQFVDKWDWTYLSKHLNVTFIFDNLDKYSKYWDWGGALPRILTSENKFDYNFLDQLAIILTNIPGSDKCQTAWTALSSQYSFKELKKLMKETAHKREYWWDMKYFCQHKDFYVFRDLEECRNFIDWDALSCSTNVDKNFMFNPRLGIKERAWHDDIRNVLADGRNHWNFKLLSHFESLRNERWFITQYKDRIDWDYISQMSLIFCEKDKQKLNEIIESFKKYINFIALSERDDVDVEQVIKINPHANYDFNNLVERCVVDATIQLVEENPNYPWNWQMVTSSPTFLPNARFLLSHIDCDLNWKMLSRQDNKKAWANEDLVYAVASDISICNLIDWYKLTSMDYFPVTREIFELLPIDKLNWKRLSGRKAIASVIDDYTDYIDWRILSGNQSVISLNLDVLEKYKEHLDWGIICNNINFTITNEILERFSDYIDWSLASASISIKFSQNLVDKYRDKWDWPVLVKNRAFHNTIDISKMPFARQINIVDFINKFPRRPKAYHFTHMDNAVKIIREMKLKCRNNADGKFSNSAGTNVHITSKAHRFARFYFVPKSPTQFYNECLGKDLDDRKYYDRARRLGLPKCPLPVFFIFDIEELLTMMPNICYYSNGNMQKAASKCFRVIENPNEIKAREIYNNSFDTFNERQQEFLIDGELDFSKLKNVKICCYNDYQTEMLRHELKGTKWEDVISTNVSLYEYENKELFFYEKKDSIEIRTDYRNQFEFRIKYLGTSIPTVINKENVIRQKDNNIFVDSYVEVNKDIPFEIYFEVSDPRTGSWLIYKNI